MKGLIIVAIFSWLAIILTNCGEPTKCVKPAKQIANITKHQYHHCKDVK